MKPCLTLFLCLPFFLQAGGNNEPTGARSVALGGASVTLVDIWSIYNNPAALVDVHRYAAGAAFQSRYVLPEAGLKSLAATAPVGRGTAGLAAQSYGYAAFSDNRIGLAYALPLAEYISLGVKINYLQCRIGDIYGSRSTVVGEVGMCVKPGKNLRLGLHLYNPGRAKLADFDDERIPTALRLGGQYLFSEKVTAVFELDKDLDLPLNIRAGVEYTPVEQFYARVGLATAQSSFALGLGYRWKSLRADVSANWHQTLGYTTGIALACEFAKRKK